MNRRAHWSHWIALLTLLASLWGPTVIGADDGPPPPADETPASPASPPVPSACLSHVSGGVNNADQPILDNSTITSSVTVSTSFSYIWSLRVFTNISHTANSQLDLTVISPAGTKVLLSDRKGGANTNVFHGTSWHDDADQPVTDFTFSNNVVATNLSPQEPLGALRGEDANGVWQLVIHDGIIGNVGVLEGWSVQVTGLSHAPEVVSTSTFGQAGTFPMTDTASAVSQVDVPSLPDPITSITLSTVITHNQPNSLKVFLTAPSGLTVTLSTNNGSSVDNAFAGTVWDDRAARTDPHALVTTHTYLIGQVASPLAPEEPLSLLLGKNATGTWLLTVSDVVSDTQAGALGPVVLHVQTGHCFPNLSPTLSSHPFYPRLAQPAQLVFGAQNTPVTATNVSLTATLNPLMRFQSLQSGSWLCDEPPPNSAGAVIHCTRASLGANQTEVVTATITAPPVAGTTSFTATVSSDVPDTDPSDNTNARSFFTYAQSANGDIVDPLLDTGAMDEGGEDAFDGWGRLRLQMRLGNILLADSKAIDLDFGLAFGGPSQRWSTTTPVNLGGVQISRQLLAPPDQNWVRYVDTFENQSGAPLSLLVSWGGDLGSDSGTHVQATSSGDLIIGTNDTWAVTQEGVPPAPATDSPVGYVLRSPGDSSYLGPVEFDDPVITTTWALSEDDALGHLFTFSLATGETRRLAYFVYRGLAEGTAGPYDCIFYDNCVTPATGAEVALADSTMAALAAQPALCDLSLAERTSLVNWTNLASVCGDLFLPIVMR